MPTAEGSTFSEELESIKNEVKQSLDQERTRKQKRDQPAGREHTSAEREMLAVRDAIAKLTGHEPKTVVPPPVNQEGGTDTDHFTDIDESVKKEVTDLVEETLSGGSIAAVAAKAMKKNDPLILDLYHDAMARETHRRFSDQNAP
ncbi:MAG: hypothetical protein OYG31_00310 [Candidatus Kaiserbacteria bacterium]|nr:hypothetical protein [Candidatus Kaiserbacteria bacterium]